MAFNDSKIAEAETTTTGVVSQPDTLLGSPQQNKAVFDALPLLIIERLNKLIDALQAGISASELGAAAFEGVTADNVQDALEAVQGNIVALQDTGGAADIGVTPFEGVTATNAQQALQQLQANLVSLRTLLRSGAGAEQIGVTPFPGVGSELLQEALQEIQQHINDIQAGMIPDYGVTWEKLAQDIVDEIEKITPSRASGELDDYTMETGTFENAGAGWNSFRFRSPFDGDAAGLFRLVRGEGDLLRGVPVLPAQAGDHRRDGRQREHKERICGRRDRHKPVAQRADTR